VHFAVECIIDIADRSELADDGFRFPWEYRRNIREEVDKSATSDTGIIIGRRRYTVFADTLFRIDRNGEMCMRKLETFRLNRGTAPGVNYRAPISVTIALNASR